MILAFMMIMLISFIIGFVLLVLLVIFNKPIISVLDKTTKKMDKANKWMTIRRKK